MFPDLVWCLYQDMVSCIVELFSAFPVYVPVFPKSHFKLNNPDSLLSLPVSGFPQNTPPNCKSGAIVTCVQSARFQSTEVWIPWTQKPSSTPKCCCPPPNTVHEMKVTWEPWAPSVRWVELLPFHLRVISATWLKFLHANKKVYIRRAKKIINPLQLTLYILSNNCTIWNL